MLVAMPDAGPRKRKVGAPNAASATVGLTGFPSVVMNFARLSAFVHISAVQRAGMDYLREGAKLRFDIVANRGKPVADNLQLK
jgi:cold shock protein